MTVPRDERPLTKRELAELTRVSTSTIDRRRREGMPAVMYGARSPRFFPSQCLPWLAQYGGESRQGEDS